jgi:hypothetical protein
MPHYEILVSYSAPLGIEFKRALRGKPPKLTSAKTLKTKIGDTVSWQLVLPDLKLSRTLLKKVTGFTVDFLTRGSPFDSSQRKFIFQGIASPRMRVTPWASGRFFPYELTIDPLGLKADPGVGVDPPGGFETELDVEACVNRAGVVEVRSPITAYAGDMLRFVCRNAAGGPVDFEVTFGAMALEDWPVYPPGPPAKPLSSIAGTGATAYYQVVNQPEDYPFTLTTTAGASVSGIIEVRVR